MNTTERNRVVTEHYPTMLHALDLYFQRFPAAEPYRDDLHAPASVALIRAVETYNPEKGAKLDTWIMTRVFSALRTEWQRSRLGYGEDEEGSSFDNIAHLVPAPEGLDPVDKVEADRLWDLALDVPDREYQILRRWAEGEPMTDIGRDLGGVSRQRIHQLREQALDRIRERVAP
jgi:RNA polymerase sigma factor (sigma-70 family)